LLSFFFEKIAFWRQTKKRTDEQMDGSVALSRKLDIASGSLTIVCVEIFLCIILL